MIYLGNLFVLRDSVIDVLFFLYRWELLFGFVFYCMEFLYEWLCDL